MWLLRPFCTIVTRSTDKENCLPSEVERTLSDSKGNLKHLTPSERRQEPWQASTPPFKFSVNLRLRSRRVFPVINGTYVLIMNVSEALVVRELYSFMEIYYIACMGNIWMSTSF